MNQVIYRYRFRPQISFRCVERWLSLAIVAAAGLHGEAAVEMDACYSFDKKRRACVVDANGGVGRDIARILTSFLRHGLKANAFDVEAIDLPGDPAQEISA